jgi:formate dehydrogenase beta subunit
MGRCETAPVAEVGHNHVCHATPETVLAAVTSGDTHAHDIPYQTLAEYRAGGGYETLQALRRGGDWEAVQAQVAASGLRGLGGAGFPSGKKWGFVRANPGPRYLAVNGDEGEPGTFKDRWLPGTRAAPVPRGHADRRLGGRGRARFIYMRDEYPGIRQILATEIAALEAAGIVAPGYIDLRRGAGAYICGEESAMIESIEGKRGLPRHRPPYVAQKGIFDRPTLVHNVETLHWVARICREGPEVLSAIEKNGRKGLRSYSVSGRVQSPGVYLLPAGSTITDIIAAAGGMAEGHRFTAYQPGGRPRGCCRPRSTMCRSTSTRSSRWAPSSARPRSWSCPTGTAPAPRAQHAAVLREGELRAMHPCRVGCEKAVKLMQEPTAGIATCSRTSARRDGRRLDLRAGPGRAEPDPADDAAFP